MMCVSGFELYSRWVPLIYNILRVVKVLSQKKVLKQVSILNPWFYRFSKTVREYSVLLLFSCRILVISSTSTTL